MKVFFVVGARNASHHNLHVIPKCHGPKQRCVDKTVDTLDTLKNQAAKASLLILLACDEAKLKKVIPHIAGGRQVDVAIHKWNVHLQGAGELGDVVERDAL